MGKYVKMWMNGESIPYVLILILDLEQETIFMMTYPCLAIVNHHFPITNPWISNHFPWKSREYPMVLSTQSKNIKNKKHT